MINLFVNFYNNSNLLRQQEINECVYRNILNPLVDRIYLVVDNLELCFYNVDKFDKIEKVLHTGWATYEYLFGLANDKNGGDDISIISNIDIYYEEQSLALVKSYLQQDTCFALSRWELAPDDTTSLFNRADSQDSWIFRGVIKNIDKADFTMGRPGCDNAIAERIAAAGYLVYNPSFDVKVIHMHRTGVRNYGNTVDEPYKYVEPCYLEQIPINNWITEIANLSSAGLQSQYSEEVIIGHIFKNIGITNRYLVDLGAGAYGDSTMSNTRKLKQSGWSGYGVDINNKGESWIIERFITPENITDILAEQNTPADFDFLNIDIDSSDFWILKKMLREYTPRLICTHFNSAFTPDIPVVLRYEEGYTWDETNKYGFSFAAGVKLLEEYGYRVIYNMNHLNIFAVKKELVKGLVFNVTAAQVHYHPANPDAVWELY